jgi:hypothetical protein
MFWIHGVSSLNQDRSIKSCSLEVGFQMLGQKFPAKARRRIIDPAMFVGVYASNAGERR